MTLTVRLDSTLESALTRHCAEHGLSKSAVVQKSLAAYLFERKSADSSEIDPKQRTSPLFNQFRDAGLIGSLELGGRSADKQAVRTRAMQRIRRPTR